MDTPSAVIDKSVFQRLCIANDHALWRTIKKRYHLVILPVLIEEVLVNILDPRDKPLPERGDMLAQIRRLYPCWVNDVRDTAARELLFGERFDSLPTPPPRFIERLAQLNLGDPGVRAWLCQREKDKLATLAQWKTAQERIRPKTNPIRVADATEAFNKVLIPLRKILTNLEKREVLVRAVLQLALSRLGTDEETRAAIARVQPANIHNFPVTLACLLARLTYFFGPNIQTPEGKLVKSGDQIHSFTDEQYVASAMLCDRLITGDWAMARIATTLQVGGFWTGEVLFWDPNKSLLP